MSEIKRVSPCCNDTLILFISLNMKMCWKCRKEYEWNLDPGQKPLF